MPNVKDEVRDFKLKAGNYMEGGMKRLGALFLKASSVAMVPIGVGLMLYGLIEQLENARMDDGFSVGVTLVILGSLLWFLARRLDAAAELVRYRRQQNRVVRLAQERGGRLSATETAADTGLTVEEAEGILKRLADGGYVELEVTQSGMVIYRFPEVLFAHEKPWARGVDSA